MTPKPADRCADGPGGVTAGHRAEPVTASVTSGIEAGERRRSPEAASRSAGEAKRRLATAPLAGGRGHPAAARLGRAGRQEGRADPGRHHGIAADVPAGVVRDRDHELVLADPGLPGERGRHSAERAGDPHRPARGAEREPDTVGEVGRG